jgi:hypothetical protein
MPIQKNEAVRASPRFFETRLRPSGFGEVRPARLSPGEISPKQKTKRIHSQASSGSSAQADKIRVGISSCLLGEKVRWDGGDRRNLPARALGRYFEIQKNYRLWF